MKNRVLKLIGITILLTILFIPSTAFAATQKHWSIATNTYLTANTNWNYYLGPSTQYGGFYNTFFHQVTDGNKNYLAYCLDPNWYTANASGTILGLNNTDLYDSRGNKVEGKRLKLLKNILAAGQQLGTYTSVESFKNNIDAATKKNFLATQILVWEVMEGARTDYSYNNLDVPTGQHNTYQLVNSDTSGVLLKKYKNILDRAYQLSDEGKPKAFGLTYVLKWNDSKNKYVNTNTINVGDYDVTKKTPLPLPLNVSVVKDKNNNLTITSDSVLSKYEQIVFDFVQGTTSDADFRWFKFSEKINGHNGQRMLLAYYQGSNSGDISIKTETGKFVITKKDLSTKGTEQIKNLKGAKFAMYKCKSTTGGCNKVQDIDMSDKTSSDEITINKSGIYKFVETQVPEGYEKIPDFFVNMTIKDENTVNVTVDERAKNYVAVAEANSSRLLHLLVYNEAKSFKISKIDGNNGAQVNGATFQIKKTDGTVMKFNKISEGKYEYNANGAVTDLVSASLGLYSISLLPVGEYILEETNVPAGYVLSPNVQERQTKFKVISTNDANFIQVLDSSNKYVTASNATVVVKNYKTKVTINKTASGGKVVPGVTFELYNSSKQNLIPLTQSGGQYYYNESASPIPLVTDANGKIVINSLLPGTYYLKEIATPEDSGLVIDPDNQWWKIDVKFDSSSANILLPIENSKGEFCFYKIDEDGNYLDKGTFRLQMYNESTSRFEDVALIQNADKTFSIDPTGKGTYVFSPVSGGLTCFVELSAKSRYKVVEIEAPEGFLLPSNQSDLEAEISINEYGYASGKAVIINKKIKTGGDANAQAELVVGISTGMDRINYVLIIGGIGIAIGILIYIKKKMDKK